jgi:hypothetical protein
VSSVVVNLCTAFQWVFIVVCVKCELRFSDRLVGKNNTFVISFVSDSGKLHWKHRKCSTQILVTIYNKTSEWFS